MNILDDLPRQKVPRKKKTTQWGKNVIDELEGISTSDSHNGRSSRWKKKLNYDLYNGILDKSDFEYVINPYGFDQGDFPANLQHYDIISPKINLLVGEEIKRPFNFKVISSSPDTVSDLEQKKTQMIKQMLQQILLAGVKNEEEAEQKIQTSEQINSYMKYNYQDVRESTGQRILEYLQKEQHISYKFNKGFKDALVAGEEVYWVGVVSGEPVMRVCNPLDITIITDPDSDFIEDAQAIIEERWLTISTVIDSYHKSLSPTQIDSLEKDFGRSADAKTGELNYPASNITVFGEDQYSADNAYNNTHDGDGGIRVLHCEWKSMRKVGFLTMVDETGQIQEELVDEIFKVPDYAIKDKEGAYIFDNMMLKWEWISEYWEGTKIGDAIYIDIKPKINQRRNMDNPSICKSGYVGMIYNARNSESVSLIDRMKAYQYLYNILYYRLELTIAKSKGKLALMDVAQIPASEGWDVDKWMYYLDALGIMFINSHEEGKRGDKSNFNQFQSIDLTMGTELNQYVAMLDKIKEEVGELAGVSKQRQGQISSSELVGNTERAVIQSSHITEYWFYLHNEVKKRALEGLIDCAKIAWRHGKKVQYVMDDMSRVFFNVEGAEFDNTEYGVFVSDSSRDEMTLNTLRQLTQAAMQNGMASMSDVIAMMQSSSIVDIKRRMETAEESRQQQGQQAQEQEQAMIQQQEQIKAETEERKEDRQDKRNTQDNNTKIEVALINAEAKQDLDLDDDGILDGLEREKLNAKLTKDAQDTAIKERTLDQNAKQNAEELKLKKEKLKIDRKKANATPKK